MGRDGVPAPRLRGSLAPAKAGRPAAPAPEAGIIRSRDLCARLGIGTSTLLDWRRERTPRGQALRACIYRATRRSTWWSVAALRQRGFLVAPTPAAVDPVPAQVVEWTGTWGAP